jgi:dihydroneopterin aldolase
MIQIAQATLANCCGRVTATGVDGSSSAVTARIHIEQLELEVRIGVGEEERARPQRVTLNLTVWLETGFDRLQDDIGRTVNYVELCRTAGQLVESREWKLIETLASELASHLLEKFPLKAVELEVRKFVLPNTQYVSATVRRTASG